jgi:hypothetical protein
LIAASLVFTRKSPADFLFGKQPKLNFVTSFAALEQTKPWLIPSFADSTKKRLTSLKLKA